MLENAPERFRSKVRINSINGCWEWTAAISPKGYGQFAVRWSDGTKTTTSHRWAMRFFNFNEKPLPKDLCVDHLCANRKCCNPMHLRLCTSRENTFATNSRATAKLHADKTHCPKGHPYSGENLKQYLCSGTRRICKICQRITMEKAYKKNYPKRKEKRRAEAALKKLRAS